MSSDIDALVLENTLLVKEDQLSNREARRSGGRSGEEIDPFLESVWQCPACGAGLQKKGTVARCSACDRTYRQDDGIWQMFAPHEKIVGDVTDAVKEFYEENPFPNYNEHDNLRSLISKSQRGLYGRLLGEQIPYNSRVLEVGCGTGQLSNFLAIGCRSVVGTDLCMNSLRLAEEFRRSQHLKRVRFMQMNLFRPALALERFDVVLCNGVLHHTNDPLDGFRRIARLVKPGGHIVVGLYNRYGRYLLDSRRVLFRLSGGRLQWIDPYLRGTAMSDDKRNAWFKDQYQHPHESKHTMGEVLRWFEESGFDYVNGIPKLCARGRFSDCERLFEPADRGTSLDRFLSQAKMIVTGSREGGFFVMIGRKRESTC